MVGLFLKIDISYACIYNSTFTDNPLKWLEPQFLENERINTWHLTWLYKWWKAKIFFIYQQSFILIRFLIWLSLKPSTYMKMLRKSWYGYNLNLKSVYILTCYCKCITIGCLFFLVAFSIKQLHLNQILLIALHIYVKYIDTFNNVLNQITAYL